MQFNPLLPPSRAVSEASCRPDRQVPVSSVSTFHISMLVWRQPRGFGVGETRAQERLQEFRDLSPELHLALWKLHG